MHPISITLLVALSCYMIPYIVAVEESLATEQHVPLILDNSNTEVEGQENAGVTLNRQKRTLFLKKKLIGAGLLGFGLGIAKGYKAGYYSAPPEVRHVYLSPPPAAVKYVEYVEKPIVVERIIERPTSFVKPIHTEYRESSPYGSW